MMEPYRNTIVVACVALYMVGCVAIGLWALGRTRSTADFFMAGRNLGVFVTAFAVFSSVMSGFGFVGGPGLVYQMGMSSVWMIISAVAGVSVSVFLVGKRLRLFAELRDSVSLPDVVAARYRSETSRFLTALAILLGVIGYLATQILAMARVLQDILANLGYFDVVSLEICVFLSCAVLVFYCVTGGIIASVYTDIIQGMVMVVASLLVFAAAVSVVEGGMEGTVTTLLRDDPESIGPWGTFGLLGCMSWFLLFTLGGAGQPHVITKMMMTRNVRDVKHILPVSVMAYCVSALLWISIGLTMRALVIQGAHPELPAADAAAPQFLQSYAHPLLAGIVFAGLFAAIMSTADGFLNIGAAAVVHDIPRALRGRSLPNELFNARVATVVIGTVAALFSLYSGRGMVALLGAFGWGTFAAALVPVVAIGFNWKRATSGAANTAILVSLVINVGLELTHTPIPYGISPGAIALLTSTTLFFGISYACRPQPLDPDIEAVMDL